MRLRYSRLLGVTIALLAASGAQAATVGNALIDRSTVDGNPAGIYIVGQAFAVAGQSLTNYSFFSDGAGDITPFLFTRLANADASTAVFKLAAIGTQRAVTTSGVVSYDFEAVTGSAVTTASSYFGFRNSAGAVVKFGYTGSVANGGTFITEGGISLRDSRSFAADQFYFNRLDALNDREYSIMASATGGATVPEPATWAMMIGGFGLVGGGMRRRRRNVHATVSFA